MPTPRTACPSLRARLLLLASSLRMHSSLKGHRIKAAAYPRPVPVHFTMHLYPTSLVLLYAVTTSLGAWTPLRSLVRRDNSTFLDCLERAGLDAVVEGATTYANDSKPFNLRYVYYALLLNGTSAAYLICRPARSQLQLQARRYCLPK